MVAYDVAGNRVEYHVRVKTSNSANEDETIKYKIVSFTEDGKKCTLASSKEVEVFVPKSTVVLLDFPYNVAMSKDISKHFEYEFKFTNRKILKNAKLVKMRFLILGSPFF